MREAKRFFKAQFREVYEGRRAAASFPLRRLSLEHYGSDREMIYPFAHENTAAEPVDLLQDTAMWNRLRTDLSFLRRATPPPVD